MHFRHSDTYLEIWKELNYEKFKLIKMFSILSDKIVEAALSMRIVFVMNLHITSVFLECR